MMGLTVDSFLPKCDPTLFWSNVFVLLSYCNVRNIISMKIVALKLSFQWKFKIYIGLFHSKVLWSIEDEWKQMQWNSLGFSDDTWFFAADTW